MWNSCALLELIQRKVQPLSLIVSLVLWENFRAANLLSVRVVQQEHFLKQVPALVKIVPQELIRMGLHLASRVLWEVILLKDLRAVLFVLLEHTLQYLEPLVASNVLPGLILD